VVYMFWVSYVKVYTARGSLRSVYRERNTNSLLLCLAFANR